MSGSTALILTLIALLAGAGGAAWYAWQGLGDVAMSTGGYIALGIGALVTLVLGVGLMWLVHFSHRRGFDDEAGHDGP